MPPARPPGIVKFSRGERSIGVAPRIVLSSPQYYRDLEEQSAPPGEQAQARRRGSRPKRETGPPGIGDRMEARYQKRYELDEFHRRFAPAPVNAPVTGSAELTYGTGGFWPLCTSVEPETSRDFERLQKEFSEYDCATTISDPSALALQLGKDFGSRHGEEAVPANAYGILRLAKIARGFLGAGVPVPEAVVDVRHGQVVYSDEAADLIESYPSQVQGMVLPFVKRTKFAGEKEYRFTVSLGGEPKKQRVCVDVSEELRSLVKPYSDG